MEDLSIIGGYITYASLMIGLILALMELRHWHKTRKTEIIMNVYNRFSEREIIEVISKVGSSKYENFEDYRNKYGFTEVMELSTLFEGLGVLLQQKLIDIKMIDQFFSPTLSFLWDKMKPIIYGMRKYLNEPFYFSHFELIVNQLNLHRKTNKT